MLQTVSTRFNDFLHLFFPHVCEGCGTDTLSHDSLLCASCYMQLPETGFIKDKDNPVEQKFYGLVNIQAAGAGFYFTKEGMLQQLIKQHKYHNNKAIGNYLGRQLGNQLLLTDRFNAVDVIVPLPLNPKREKKRGYNQAAVIANGIGEVWEKPVHINAVTRSVFTDTQTHKDRITRWQSMRNVFSVTDEAALRDKNILLIDDIITTGATVAACGEKILAVNNTKLFIASVAFTI